MTPAELTAFSRALRLVAEACGRRLTSDTLDAYAHLLDDLPIGALCRAMERFAGHADTGRKFPSPRELRAWLSEGSAAGTLTADQEARIRQRVTEAMDDWEAEGRPGGSAWPPFELAWSAALRVEGLRGDLRPLQREQAWRRWLQHGADTPEAAPRVTRPQMVATLRGVAARDRAGAFSPDGTGGRMAWMDTLADEMARRLAGDPAPLTRTGNVFADAFIDIVERDPGEEG